MPRLPRLKVEGEDAWYHLWNSANGPKRAFPLQNDAFYTLREQRGNYVPT